MRSVAAILLLALSAFAQTQTEPVTKIAFRVEPESRRLRPGESAVVQIKLYNDRGRLRQANSSLVLSPVDSSGWLSKPFKFQGTDNEPFVETASSTFGRIFGSLAGNFTVKDAVLYTAPDRAGRYRIEAVNGSVRESVEIIVEDNAPSLSEPEKWRFNPEAAPTDPYRKLAERYAPYVAQETWFDWKADAICRFDFDGDWDGGNNWDNLGAGSTQAYVYYATIETKSHWFVTYNFFHARDYSDNCIAGTCHENDNEGVILTIRKDGSEFGKLEAMEALAHNMVYSYTADPSIGRNAHNIEGPIALINEKPVVFLEAGGHGALGGGDKKSFFDPATGKWKQNTGITYVYKGSAERPRFNMDREVGYELLSIYDHWWSRARNRGGPGEPRTFSAFYRYTPFGNRPQMRGEIAGSFFGLKHGADKAKPFWGWHDMTTQRRKILATGQWGADPAYAVTQNLRFPADKPVSLEYTFNPYLDVNTPGPEFGAVSRAIAVEFPPNAPASVPAAPATSAPAPAPAPEVKRADEGSCTLDLRVDGGAAIAFENGQPKLDTLAGRPVEAIKTECTAGVSALPVRFTVEKREGRGDVRLTDPNTGRVEIQDTARGDALYRIVLRWTPATRGFFNNQ